MTSLSADGSSGKIKVVVQRCNSASLLIDNDKQWQSISNGIVIYLSFTTLCTPEDISKAAIQIANLPVATLTNWGDEQKPQSVRDYCQQNVEIGIMLIPQAGLVSKIKGKSLQYRNQAPKETGRKLYKCFCNEICRAVVDKEIKKVNVGKKELRDPRTSPINLFRQHYTKDYSTFDEEGVPTTDINGETVSKSKRKKLIKAQKAQEKLHNKYLIDPGPYEDVIAEIDTAAGNNSNNESKGEEQEQEEAIELPKHFQFVCGTFGNRQGLKIDAECGPFTHSYTFN